MRKKIINILLICFCLFLLLSCQKKEVIKIGTNAWPPCELWYLAEEKGFFDDVDVEIVRYSAWSDNVNSAYVGDVDISHSTYFNTVKKNKLNKNIQAILISDYIVGADGLCVRNDINNAKDLIGKKIAVEINTDEHFLLYTYLRNNDIDINDISIISTTSKDASELFKKNEVDACFTYEPYLSEAIKDNNGKILATTENMKGLMVDVLIADKRKYDQRKEDYQKVLNAYYKAQEFVLENPKEAFKIMSKNENMDEEDFGAFYSEFNFISKEKNKSIMNSKDLEQIIKRISNFLFESKFIPEKVGKGDLIDISLIEDL